MYEIDWERNVFDMIRKLNENTCYEAECVFDKQGRDMILYTSSVNEVDCNRKPKDSLKREGSFMVQRKYFNTRDEAQDFIDSIPKVSSPSRDESIRKRRSRSMNESLNVSKMELDQIGYTLDNKLDNYFNYLLDNVFQYDEWGYTRDMLKGVFYIMLEEDFRGIKSDIEENMWNIMVNYVK